MDYDVIIGFETHVELKTRTKLFCDCPVSYEAEPNSVICPVCTGQPGSLPVLNKRAVEYTVLAGLAMNCRINEKARFARKNYFYPDLPKGYQISQYEMPLCEDGYLEILGDDGTPCPVGIRRIHLEEDAGKLVHSSNSFETSDYSLVDYNRSGVPLLEIVTDHQRNPLRSTREAKSYLEKLRQILTYLEISDCSMEKGQFRCDVNISLRPKGYQGYGNRAEIKNMASFKSIMDALDYEIGRQSEVLSSGGTVAQETRLFDEDRRITRSMRSKEDAPDYRYFPDPDLLDLGLDHGFVEGVRMNLPELPEHRVRRFIKESGIPEGEAYILTKEKGVADFFSACAPLCRDRKKLSRWIIKELFRLLNLASISIEECPVGPEGFAVLINYLAEGRITEMGGRTVLEEMFKTGAAPQDIISELGLETIKDRGLLAKAVEEVMEENPRPVSQILGGKREAIKFLIGQVMRKTRGKADPKEVRELLGKRLGTPG
ncbi:MAG: Asp-tRNA(Asn)/Glu-tRNA(Gln) amidotransferase subunit GatB [Deltaproteobacteria bacterium]|nr:Asp-tRNA(Asn)/Glu-tRNA(Gln) amidotransferase subunit GatB [Deltaproteobacteria bacterium]MBW2137454.1 Asp-tRNA(Asn)/Glu-tRNA(Gln) amidotransferase subunit GatB [Deltaproteobacteria bacterium]